ncbi:OmpA family protein [Phaeodactylibacter luteus]|uniref:OmpA family protein n=1 Tax=Phaeodactylibacter luteus TaxID=1564516 RepID=A0A5C6RGQ5_9BACT|nr:OmpA family protein [Phaeodactylibacter luteus]TXB61293.1 OmpA family protein [Phaeodactylibacter luteus]
MRKLFLLLLLLAGTHALQAQNEANKNAFSAKLLFLDYGRANDVEDLKITNGLEIGYYRSLLPWLNIGIPLKSGVINVNDDINNRTFFSAEGVLQLQLPADDQARIIPYLMGGGGITIEQELGQNVQFPAGAGLSVRIGAQSYLNLQGEYRISQEENRNNIQLGVGYLYKFGRSDRDGDGVSDAIDECPDQAGAAATNGCPDTDLDGIADHEDECPARPGPAKTNGCPDTDEDGLVDSEDDCPEVAGVAALNGCPDTDEDGIADDDDDCPEVAGLAALNGCPDTDGDGIADDDDDCPEVAGVPSGSGCPDEDGDGIADEEDDCPEQFGLASLNGCPEEEAAGTPSPTDSDRDGDGIANDLDACPDQAGPASADGCPDGDGDGFADSIDMCPGVAGLIDGCPDTDGDGVHDGLDACPDEVGDVSNRGCPKVSAADQETLDIAMRAVQFEPGKATLLGESREILDQIKAIMDRYPAYKLAIYGHTDDVGDSRSNQVLSEERAKSCFQYLVSIGADPRRMSFEGFGESQPIANNRRINGRLLNRRVEFNLYIE